MSLLMQYSRVVFTAGGVARRGVELRATGERHGRYKTAGRVTGQTGTRERRHVLGPFDVLVSLLLLELRPC
jgi:hypothetical protein